VDGLWAAKSEGVGLSVCAISFQDLQPMWSWSTNVTDRRTTCNLNTALCTNASRDKNVYNAISSHLWHMFTDFNNSSLLQSQMNCRISLNKTYQLTLNLLLYYLVRSANMHERIHLGEFKDCNFDDHWQLEIVIWPIKPEILISESLDRYRRNSSGKHEFSTTARLTLPLL